MLSSNMLLPILIPLIDVTFSTPTGGYTHRQLTVPSSISGLCDSQLFLNLLQRHTLRFRNHRLHPNQLEHHHAGKKQENVAGREGGNHLGEKCCEQGGENPVSEAAESLSFRAMTIGKYFGDQYPDDCALADGVRGDESENANRHDGEMAREKGPRD